MAVAVRALAGVTVGVGPAGVTVGVGPAGVTVGIGAMDIVAGGGVGAASAQAIADDIRARRRRTEPSLVSRL